MNSRASVLELGDSSELAEAVLSKVGNDRIGSWELNITALKSTHVVDPRFKLNVGKLPLRDEYDVLVLKIDSFASYVEYIPFLTPFLCRFVFIYGIPTDLQDNSLVINHLKNLGYTLMEHDGDVIYVQYLYRTTKYPHFPLTDKFPYQHPDVPKGVMAWMSKAEINALMEEGKGKTYLEIGTFDGFSANMMVKVVDRMIIVDPYDTAPGRLGQVMKNTIYPNIDKIVNITGFSQNSSWIFKPELIDVLLIDGDHHSTAVKRDYFLYRPLVKNGGIIAFHDYGNFPTVGHGVDHNVFDPHYKSVETLCMFKKDDSLQIEEIHPDAI
jgi:hypothetical protein